MKRILLLLAASASANADTVISFNVERWGTIPRDASNTAGVVDAPFWNDGWGNYGLSDGGYNGSTASNLWDSDGVATSLDASFVTFNTWTDNATDADPGPDTDGTHNIRLLHGYLNAGAAGWGPPTTVSSITLSEIPYTEYDLYVYFNSADNTRTGEITDGTSTFLFTSMAADVRGGDGNAVFSQTTNTVDYTTSANYAVFTGLSGSSQTLTADFSSGGDGAWGGIAGFQLVAIPPVSPEFTTQPEDYDGFVGDTVVLTASALSDPAPTYQWQYSPDDSTYTDIEDGGRFSGAETGTLTIAPGEWGDYGYYRVIASNPTEAISDPALVDLIYPDPVITAQSTTVAAEEGSDVVLSVTATGLGTLTYQWYVVGEEEIELALAGETSATLELDGVSASDEGIYFVEVFDDAAVADEGSETSVLSADMALAVFAPWDGLVSEEPFDIAAGYVVGGLPTQSPAIDGYLGAWTEIDFGTGYPAIESGSLAYADGSYLGSSGDKVSVINDVTGGEITALNSGRVFRPLSAGLVVADNTSGTRYLSFLFQSGLETGDTVYQSLALYAGDTADSSRYFDFGLMTAGGANYAFGDEAGTYNSTGVAADTGVHLVVVKFDLSDAAASDNLTVWVDPALGAGDPAGGVTVSGKDLRWDRMAFSDYDGNSAAWDEVRWGSSFDSVTLNPNPPADDYAAWIGGYPGVGAMTGFDEDPDGDGIDNGVENFLGTAPDVFNAGPTITGATGSSVTITHSRTNDPASDVTGSYEWSSDLASWNGSGDTDGNGVTVTISPVVTDDQDAPLNDTVEVTATVTGGSAARLFVRVAATQTAP